MILGLLLLLDSNPPLPPLKRLQTVLVSPTRGNSANYIVEGNTVCIAATDGCTAYSLPDMKKKWSAALPHDEEGTNIAYAANAVFVQSSGGGEGGHFVALDPATGRTLWSVATTVSRAPMAIDGSKAYVYLAPGVATQIDLATRKQKVVHRSKVSDRNSVSLDPYVFPTAGEGVLLLVGGASTTAIDPDTGRTLWASEDRVGYGPLIVDGLVVFYGEKGAVARKLKSGALVWRNPDIRTGAQVPLPDHRLAILSGRDLEIVDLGDGKILKQVPVTSGKFHSGRNEYAVKLGDWIFAATGDHGGVFDLAGNVVYRYPGPATFTPIWANGGRLVTFDGQRLMQYGTAQPETEPEPAVMAKSLAEQFEQLDPIEVAKLEALGAPAFYPLLETFLRLNAAGRAQAVIRPEEVLRILYSVVKAEHTDALLKAAREAKDDETKTDIYFLLAKNGEPDKVVPLFLKPLQEHPDRIDSPAGWGRNPGLDYVLNSSDPRAVAFVIEQYRKGLTPYREEGYFNLARTGGAEGLRLVLNARHTRQLLKTLKLRVLDELNSPESRRGAQASVHEKKDKSGHIWGLGYSRAAGNSQDLWLVQKVGGKWANPVFTGKSTTKARFSRRLTPPTDKDKGEELLKSNWADSLPKDASIHRDSDGDGVTDLVEKRLGTNPNAKDTDGDGDNDSVDPWPNAPNRALSDDEQILAAVVEARFHFNDRGGANLFFAPAGATPFEMPGLSGVSIWLAAEGRKAGSHPLEHLFGTGPGFIRVGGPATENEEEAMPGDEPLPTRATSGIGSAIEWDASHNEATVRISVYYGGLDGTGFTVKVRKFGSDWVVTGMRMAYIS